MPMNILIADHHSMFRLALRHMLADYDDEIEITEVDSQAALELAVLEKDFDLVLVDLMMPDATGFSSLIHLCCLCPKLPIVVFASTDGSRTVCRARELGAAAFVPKWASLETMNSAINKVIDGGFWFPEQKEKFDETDARPTNLLEVLTPQELRVLRHLTGGLFNKQIAAELSLSLSTVKAHVGAVLKKLGCNSRTQAAVLANTEWAAGSAPTVLS